MKNVVVAKMETTTPTCKDSLQVGEERDIEEVIADLRESRVK